jgi:uncharacterized membrane protein
MVFLVTMIAQKPGSFDPPLSTLILWAIRGLALIAVGLAAYLSWRSAEHGTLLGCGDGATLDCSAVLASSWARVLGAPIAMLGVVCYAAIFLVSWLVGVRNIPVARWAMALLALLVTSVVGSILWFIGLQLVQLQAFCLYCLGVHLCGGLIAILFVVGTTARLGGASRNIRSLSPLQASLTGVATVGKPTAVVTGLGQFGFPIFLGLIGVAGLIALQVWQPGKTYEIATLSEAGGQLEAEPVLLKPPASAPGSAPPVSDDPAATPDDPTATPSKDIDAPPKRHTAHRMVTVGVADGHGKEGEGADSELAVLDALLNKETKKGKLDDSADAIKNEAWTEGKYDIGFKPAKFDLGVIPDELSSQSRITDILKGRLFFDIYEEAYLGSPEAPNVVIELFDYTCRHCRQTHKRVHSALRHYGDQLAFVVMPVPLELRCNRFMKSARPQNIGACNLAKIALIVSKLEPNQFARFHEWMMADEEKPRRYEQALVRAYQDVGRVQVRSGLEEADDIDARISRHVNIFANLGSEWTSSAQFGMPVFIAGDKIASGSFVDDQEYFDFIELAFDIEPVQQ